MYVSMRLSVYVMHVSMSRLYVIYICTYVSILCLPVRHKCIYVCMNTCRCVCNVCTYTFVCTHVCMYVSIVRTYEYIYVCNVCHICILCMLCACLQLFYMLDPVIARQLVRQVCETGSLTVWLQACCRYHRLRHRVPNQKTGIRCGMSRVFHPCTSVSDVLRHCYSQRYVVTAVCLTTL
jgi:hypothetical protein